MKAPRIGTTSAVYTPAILLLAAIVGGSFMGLGFIMPLRAIYARSVGSSSVEIGLMTSAYLLASVLAAPFIGRLTDRLGAARLLWAGLAVHAVIVVAYLWAHSGGVLIALRAAEGVAAAAVLPPARALVNRLAPAHRQGEALGLLGAAMEGGILLGPVAGTILASSAGYTPSFLIGGGGMLLGAIAAFCCLPRERVAAPATYGRRAGFGAEGTFTRPLRLAYGLSGIMALPHGVMMALWTIYMLDRGASLPLIGLTYTAAALPGLITSPLAGRWSDRNGRYWPIVLSFVGVGIIYIVYGLPLSPLALLAICAIEGALATVARVATDGLLADATPAGMQGRVQANFTAFTAVGRLIGSTAAGAIYILGPGVPWMTMGAICLVGGLALFLPWLARPFGEAEATREAAVARAREVAPDVEGRREAEVGVAVAR